MATSVDVSQYAPGLKLAINGNELDPAAAYSVLSLRIDQELNKTNGFAFDVQDEFNEGHFTWLETDWFRVGNSVSISLGYTHSLVSMLDGKIKNLNASFNTGCAPTFTVEGTDKAYDLLTTPSETKVFTQKRDSDMVREIAQLAGLDADVEDTQAVVPIRTKAGGKSYLEFLDGLASEDNFEFFLGGRRLHFRPHSYRASVARLVWGKDLIRFEPQLNTSSAVTEVVVRGWDAQGKKQIEARARAGDEVVQEGQKQTSSRFAQKLFGDVVKVITDRPVRSFDDAQQMARSELNQASDNLVQATVDAVGNSELVPGVCLDIDGFGTVFSGKYYIVKATHTLNKEGYRISLNVRRNAV